MTFDQILLVLLIAGATVLYLTRWLPTEVTSLLIIAGLGLTGILDASQALSGFSSTALVTVAAMFVLSGGLLRTGALEAVTVFLVRFSQGSLRRLLLSIGVVSSTSSAFVNNTPVVVMLVPVLLSLSRQMRIRPAKLLIPLSYFSIMGGTMTLLGTSTNILLDDLYRQAGGPGFGIFEFFPLGVNFYRHRHNICGPGGRTAPPRSNVSFRIGRRAGPQFLCDRTTGRARQSGDRDVGQRCLLAYRHAGPAQTAHFAAATPTDRECSPPGQRRSRGGTKVGRIVADLSTVEDLPRRARPSP